MHPREVFRCALHDNAKSIILAHNHPSGDPKPSIQDLKITKKLIECGQLLDIPVLDHLIIGGRDIFRYEKKDLSILISQLRN